ncbi:hypothetical protein [Rhodococcus qingshengii]|uniref:hypothetical protein n=1 Tax=Rhodococcus qingshengii TaxID=334542 RepID=UPI001BE790C2|nr:hypothetical protein [Rhodococcus qingshengii]MBT2272721.1 hypothetical protein [Rhodococcus qingshengii]
MSEDGMFFSESTTGDAVECAYRAAIKDGLLEEHAYAVIRNALLSSRRDDLISERQWRALQLRLEGL